LQPAFLTLCLSQPPTLPAFRSSSINAHIWDIHIGGSAYKTQADVVACLSAFPFHATPTSLTVVDFQDLGEILMWCANSPSKHRLVTVDTLSLKVCICSPIWVMGHDSWHIIPKLSRTQAKDGKLLAQTLGAPSLSCSEQESMHFRLKSRKLKQLN